MFNRRGMTMVEVLLVASMVAMVTLALFNSFVNGIKIWERSRQLVLEEDIAIFLDKFSVDLRNAFDFSKLPAKGSTYKFAFPTLIHTLADPRAGLPPQEYIDQIGMVEYYYDSTANALFRRQANYGQALRDQFGPPYKLAGHIDSVQFHYHYYIDDGEKVSDGILDYVPSAVEIEIGFSYKPGERRVIRKFINVPLNS